jgi:hypothetical protein
VCGGIYHIRACPVSLNSRRKATHKYKVFTMLSIFRVRFVDIRNICAGWNLAQHMNLENKTSNYL